MLKASFCLHLAWRKFVGPLPAEPRAHPKGALEDFFADHDDGMEKQRNGAPAPWLINLVKYLTREPVLNVAWWKFNGTAPLDPARHQASHLKSFLVKHVNLDGTPRDAAREAAKDQVSAVDRLKREQELERQRGLDEREREVRWREERARDQRLERWRDQWTEPVPQIAREWVVWYSKPPGAPCGLVVHRGTGAVEQILPGLALEYNLWSPSEAVELGDRIVRVNHENQHVDTMIDLLQHGGQLEVVFQRRRKHFVPCPSFFGLHGEPAP